MTLHIEDKGRGPTVVLLHGTPMAPSHLRPLADRLSEHYRVLLVHLSGYGRSAPLEPYSLQRSLEVIEHEIESRHVGDVHLVGVGAGGYRALAVSGSRRLRVRSVCMLGGFASLDSSEKLRLAAFADMLRAGVDRRLLVESVLSPRGRNETFLRIEVERWAASVSHEYLSREIEAFIEAPGLCGMLEDLRAPIMMRVGTLDAMVSLENMRRIATASRVNLEEVEGAGHALLCEDFEATARSVETFLANVTPARTSGIEKTVSERLKAKGYWR